MKKKIQKLTTTIQERKKNLKNFVFTRIFIQGMREGFFVFFIIIRFIFTALDILLRCIIIFFSYMMESFNRVKEFVVTLMIRCAASLLAVYYTCKRTTHIKSNRLSSLSLFDFLYLMSLYMFCVCVCVHS